MSKLKPSLPIRNVYASDFADVLDSVDSAAVYLNSQDWVAVWFVWRRQRQHSTGRATLWAIGTVELVVRLGEEEATRRIQEAFLRQVKEHRKLRQDDLSNRRVDVP